MNTSFSSRYVSALLKHLDQGTPATLNMARKLGLQAVAQEVELLEIARLQEDTMVRKALPRCSPPGRILCMQRAGEFFALAIAPMADPKSSPNAAEKQLKQIIEVLGQRTVELAASNLELNTEITLRKAVEEALKKSENHFSKLLAQSDRMQEQLRRLSRQILSAQEEERKKISRELHDVIAQTLTSINIRLSTLKKEASLNTKSLARNIDSTQRLVEKSVNIVHQFARELRPAVLDDLGLIPALHSYIKSVATRTGLRIRLTTFAEVERLDTARRTILYRVAQEALTNIVRHARATHVSLIIQKEPGHICMKITDDGKSFNVEKVLHNTQATHLGILGMRERLEMVGGSLSLKSIPGKGTTVAGCIPFPLKSKSPTPRRRPTTVPHE
jgi:signal transduction histidine kinase